MAVATNAAQVHQKQNGHHALEEGPKHLQQPVVVVTKPTPVHKKLLSRLQHFIVVNFLIIGFMVALVWALTWPEPGRALAHQRFGGVRIVSFLNNCMVFLVSGLTLRMSHFRRLGTHWQSVLYGLVVILLGTPLLAPLALRLPLEPLEFRQGLAIFAIVPTTLGVGIALVQAAHGNLAMALLLTVSTNLMGVITVPYTLQLVLGTAKGSASSSYISPSALVGKLLLTVLIPTVIGSAVRASSRRVRHWITHHRASLSMFSSTNLFMIVWQSLSGARDLILQQRGMDLLGVALAAASIFAALLLVNFSVARHLLKIDPPEVVAITIMTSMKSGVVGIAIISYITPDLATAGLLIIPCVMGQLSQIFIGSATAHHLSQWVLQHESKAVVADEEKGHAGAKVAEDQKLLRSPTEAHRFYDAIEEEDEEEEEGFEDAQWETEEEAAMTRGV